MRENIFPGMVGPFLKGRMQFAEKDRFAFGAVDFVVHFIIANAAGFIYCWSPDAGGAGILGCDLDV